MADPLVIDVDTIVTWAGALLGGGGGAVLVQRMLGVDLAKLRRLFAWLGVPDDFDPAARDERSLAFPERLAVQADERSAAFRGLAEQRDAALLAAVQAVDDSDRKRDEQLLAAINTLLRVVRERPDDTAAVNAHVLAISDRLDRWETEMARTLTGVLELQREVAAVVGDLKRDRDEEKAERERARAAAEAEARTIEKLKREGRLRDAPAT